MFDKRIKYTCVHCGGPASHVGRAPDDPNTQVAVCQACTKGVWGSLPIAGAATARAVAYVADHPHCTAGEIARHLDPDNRGKFGYRVVARATKAGLLLMRRGADAGQFHVSPLGRCLNVDEV